MSITLEQIDLLRERANVSYEDAKDALEKCDNKIVDAIIYLEKAEKIKDTKKESCCNGFVEKTKGLIKKGNETKLIIKKQDTNVLNLPVTAAAIIGIIAPPIAVLGIPVALLTSHKIKLEKNTGEELKVNKVLDKVSDAVSSVASKITDEVSETKNKTEE